MERNYDFLSVQNTHNIKKYTLKTATQEWLKAIKMVTKESTYSKYCTVSQLHIIPNLGEILLSHITQPLLEQYVYDKYLYGRVDGKGALSANTVRLITYILESVLQYAKQMGYTNIVYAPISKPRLSQKNMQLFTIEEQKKLEQFVLTRKDFSAYGVYICLYTGMRLGELCALTWENVHLEERYIRVMQTLQRIQVVDRREENQNKRTKIIIDVPKSQSSIRDIPLINTLANLLERIKGKEEKAYVLTGKSTHFMDPRNYQKRFKHMLKACDLQPRNFHTLRHQFASNCIAQGIDAKSLSEILGHSSVNITLNRYVHTSMELKQLQINKLEEWAK